MSKWSWTRKPLVAFGAMLLCAVQVSADPLVVNGDFEAETGAFTVWPGYVGNGNPDNISGWTGDGGRGVNPVAAGDAPFRDNGGNDTHVAFLQGTSYIEQTVGGFNVGSDYILSLDFNSRNCCGDFPIGTITLNGIVAGSSVALFPPPGSIPPVGGTNPWYHADIEFTAPTPEIVLRVATAPGAAGDSTMLVDNVSFRAVPEPASASLLLIGAVALAGRRRR